MTVLNGVSAKHMDSFFREPDTGWEWQVSDGSYTSDLGELLRVCVLFLSAVEVVGFSALTVLQE